MIKNSFLKMRKNLMVRTIQAEIQKKKVMDWTLPKLLEQARREERARTAAMKEKERILQEKGGDEDRRERTEVREDQVGEE